MPIKIIRRTEAQPQPEPAPIVPESPSSELEGDGLDIPAFLRRKQTPDKTDDENTDR